MRRGLYPACIGYGFGYGSGMHWGTDQVITLSVELGEGGFGVRQHNALRSVLIISNFRLSSWKLAAVRHVMLNILRGTKGIPRKGVWASVNTRVWKRKELRAKHDQTSFYLRPPFLGTPSVPSRNMLCHLVLCADVIICHCIALFIVELVLKACLPWQAPPAD